MIRELQDSLVRSALGQQCVCDRTCHDATPVEAVVDDRGRGWAGALGAEGSPVRMGRDTGDGGLLPAAVDTDTLKKYVVAARRFLASTKSPASVELTWGHKRVAGDAAHGTAQTRRHPRKHRHTCVLSWALPSRRQRPHKLP